MHRIVGVLLAALIPVSSGMIAGHAVPAGGASGCTIVRV